MGSRGPLQVLTQFTLPQPPFKGQIGHSYKDSKPDFQSNHESIPNRKTTREPHPNVVDDLAQVVAALNLVLDLANLVLNGVRAARLLLEACR